MTRLVTRVRKRLSRASLVVLTSVIRSLSSLIPYRIAVALGGVVGFLSFYLIPRDRERAIDHLARCFPERDRRWVERTARGSFVHLGKALLELMKVGPKDLSRVVEFSGREKLDAALSQGKGVVYMTGHIGNWELMGAAVAAHGPLSVVAAPIEPEAVNDQIVGLRARLGVKTILRSKPGAAKELIRVFRENRILGILIDQDTDVEGAFVPFFGAPAWTPTAAAQMAIKFGAAVVFGFIRRGPGGRHRITIEGPLDLTRTGNDEEDIRINTARFTALIEQAIRECPEQWVWMHRRWRRQP
jgi:KDO2-lipid IV(A) lauroyltransferase